MSSPMKFSGGSSQPKTSGKATASLIFGIASLFMSCLAGLPGIILGIMALGDIGRSRGGVTGKGLAIAGIVCSVLMSIVSLAVIGGCAALLLPAIQGARNAARTTVSTDNIRQIELAMHNHHDARKAFPVVEPVDGELSWRVDLLPYLEENDLYQQFDMNQGPNGPRNSGFKTMMPSVFSTPMFESPLGMSPIQVPVSMPDYEGPAFSIQAQQGAEGVEPATFGTLADGSSNTAMLVLVDESRLDFSWTEALADFQVDPSNPALGLFETPQGTYIIGFADGSVQPISSDIDPQALLHIMQRNDGQVINFYDF